MKSKTRHLLRIFIYLPITLFVILALAIGTPVGSQISISLVQALVPNISLKYNSGTLNKSLSIANLNINFDNLKIKADSVDLTWNPVCFIHSQLCVNQLNAKNTVVEVIRPKPESETVNRRSSANTAFKLPFSISAKQANFNAISVKLDHQAYSTSKLSIVGNWDNNGLKLSSVISDGFTMKGVWNASSDKKSDNVQSHSHKTLLLPAIHLPFPIYIASAELFNNNIGLAGKPFIFNSIKIKNTNWIDTELSTERLQFRHAGILSKLSGTLNFNNSYPVNLIAHISLQEKKEIANTPLETIKQFQQLDDQQVELHLTHDFSNLQIKGNTNGQINSSLDANINLLKSDIPFSANVENLTGEWRINQGKFEAKDLQLNASGSLSKINLVTKGEISSPLIPNLFIDGHANIDKEGISNTNLMAKSPNGSVKLIGEFSWQPNLHWKLKADFNKLKVNQFGDNLLEKLPATTIDGHLDSTVSFDSSNWSFDVLDSNLSGSFKGQPFKIKGTLRGDSSYNFDAKKFDAKILGTTIQLQENLQTGKLSGTLKNNDLAVIFPELNGSLKTIFTLSKASNQQPEIWHKTAIERIRYDDITVQKIALSGIYQPLNKQYNETQFKAHNVSLYGLLFKGINVKIKGTDTNQDWSIKTRSKVNMTSRFTSKISDDSIALSIPELSIQNKKSNWSLSKTINLLWNRKNTVGKISDFCLRNADQYFCSENDATFGKDGKINLTYNGKVNEIIQPFMPPHLALDGNLNAHSQLRWRNNSKPTANLDMALGAGKLLLYPHRKIPREFPYQFLTLKATLDKQTLHLISKLKAENYAHWDSDLSIGIAPRRQISGTIDFSRIQLAPIAEFLPIFNTLTGTINSKLNLSGNLFDPTIKGRVSLDQGEVAFIKNPTKFHNINLDLVLDNKRAEIAANWDMDKGKAKLSGNLDWLKGFLKGQVNISGKNLTAIEPPLAILTVDPNININVSNRDVTVNGDINVTDGDITITPLPKQGIPLSNDVVFVDKQQQTTPEPSFNLTSNININVSNKLAINGMGLSGNLGGKLSMRQSSGTQPLLFGDIKVQNGNYRFLGQTLDIQKGSLEFVGPAENPTLDIEAVKDINDEDITVGVKVSGTANNPNISLFSNPALEQAEIVSYLLQGRGFNSTSSDDQQNNNNALLLSAALTLGSQAGDHNPIASVGNSAESLASKLGIKNVQLNANDDGKLAISGYIGDRLLLKYGYGVFDPGYELTIRYYLLSKLYLESVSSALGQSLDIYYRFDIGSPTEN